MPLPRATTGVRVSFAQRKTADHIAAAAKASVNGSPSTTIADATSNPMQATRDTESATPVANS